MISNHITPLGMSKRQQDGASPRPAGRLKAKDPRAIDHMTALLLDAEKSWIPEQIMVDTAHTIMIAEQGMITREQARRLLDALEKAMALAEAGDFPLDRAGDSLLPQALDFYVAEAGPDAGGRLHTGRSRIDAIAAVKRLYARNCLLRVYGSLTSLLALLLRLAEEHRETIMPGWSHLQHAQPWVLGHYLLKTFDVFARHAERLQACYHRTNRSALGGAALVGSGWPLDRRRVCELLGHEALVYNAMDAGLFTSDWLLEYNAVLSMLMNDVGRSASDLVVWHSWEFGLAELDDGFCSTSTLMPQKKNAGSAEYLRGCAGDAVGWYASAASISRSATTIDCDIHYSPDLLAKPANTTWHCLELLAGVYDTITFKTDVMRRNAGVYWSTASGLADSIADQSGVSFREAHHVVARLVRNCLTAGIKPHEVTGRHLDEAAGDAIGRALELETSWVQAQLDPVNFLNTRVTAGSAHQSEITKQLDMAQATLARDRQWLAHEQACIRDAGTKLADAKARIRAGT